MSVHPGPLPLDQDLDQSKRMAVTSTRVAFPLSVVRRRLGIGGMAPVDRQYGKNKTIPPTLERILLGTLHLLAQNVNDRSGP